MSLLLKALRQIDWKRRAHRDAIILAALGLIVFVIGTVYDLPPVLLQFGLDHSDWEVDDIILVVLVLSVAIFIYGYRRYQDLSAEVRARAKAEAEAHNLARHDPLTGLPNRRFFEETLAERLQTLEDGEILAVILLDLNGFKPVNDTHGHAVGDEALRIFASRIAAVLRPKSFLARLGGDEFAIVKPHMTSPDAAANLGRRIIGTIAAPLVLDTVTVGLGVSVGIAIAPNDGTSADVLLRRADRALYRAKLAGGSSVCFFEQEMDAHFDRRINTERELRKTVELNSGEIVPHYQPLISLADGKVIGFEALSRWKNDVLGPIAPDIFIPIAEETRLICPLGDALLRRACLDARSWPHDYLLAFNVSAVQLREPGFGLRLLSILSETGFNPHRLEVEITETAVVENIDLVQATIADLRQAGVRVALDDFGTGYATLSHLCTLQIDKIKIDKSFVSKLFGHENGEVIIRAILGLAHGLGLTTTAEGVEDEKQLAFLKDHGCGEGQGYLFSKAMRADQVVSFLNQVGSRASA
jgi:diguanylate cyclase (GGDEF)-like protein